MLCITCFVPDICLFFYFYFFFFQASLLSTGTGYLHGLAFYGFYLHIVGLCFAVGERDTKVLFVY